MARLGSMGIEVHIALSLYIYILFFLKTVWNGVHLRKHTGEKGLE